MSSQPQILALPPPVGRYLVLQLRLGRDAKKAIARLREIPLDHAAVGVGASLALAVGAKIPGLRTFPALAGPNCSFPSTPGALFVFIAAGDPSELHDRSRAILAILADDFAIDEDVTSFRYREGRDLTGYVDGTENPTDERAVEAAIVSGRGPGLDGSSFVAVQRWIHSLDRFAGFTSAARDHTIGRRISDNAEIADAPITAHVKRTAQESFDPPAFMVRRSMPFVDRDAQGLYFVAYGESLDRFERVLRRMAGLEDGVVDSLLGFSRAVTGGYYWCPPVADDGRSERGMVVLDLRALG
jgi:putative iron-dependent peroxidase